MTQYNLVDKNSKVINNVIATGYTTSGPVGTLVNFHTMQSLAMHYRSHGEKVFVKRVTFWATSCKVYI